MDKKLYEVLLSIAKTLTALTTEILEIKETVNKLNSNSYEIKTNKEIVEALNKELKDKGGKK